MDAPVLPPTRKLPDEPDMDAWALVASARDGDAGAYGELYQRYVDVVFRFVLYRVGDRPLAEDLTSETFVRALRRIDRVTYRGRDVGAWFITIARNLILDHVKSSRYRLDISVGDASMGTWVDERVPDDEVIERDTAVRVLRAMGRLTDEQREVLQLRFMQGLSVTETAAAVDKSEPAVKALQYRGTQRLALMAEIRALR